MYYVQAILHARQRCLLYLRWLYLYLCSSSAPLLGRHRLMTVGRMHITHSSSTAGRVKLVKTPPRWAPLPGD